MPSNTTTLQPAPGYIIVDTNNVESSSSAYYNPGKDQEKKVLRGKILAIGTPASSKYSGTPQPMDDIVVGDIVWFLSYGGDYDNALVDNRLLYFVNYSDYLAKEQGGQQ